MFVLKNKKSFKILILTQSPSNKRYTYIQYIVTEKNRDQTVTVVVAAGLTIFISHAQMFQQYQ